LIPFFACYKLKAWLGYDDALDTFGVHAVGGTLGACVTGVFATLEVNSNLATNLKDIVGKTLWIEQLKAVGITLALAVIGTTIIAFALKAVLGLRVSEDVETAGLDISEHGEEGYHEVVFGHSTPAPVGEGVLTPALAKLSSPVAEQG